MTTVLGALDSPFMARNGGRPRRLRPKEQVHIMLPADLHAWVKRKAEEQERTISSYTRWLYSQQRQREEDAQKEPEAALA